AVLVWRRWNWLRALAVALVLGELAGWVGSAEPSVTRGFVVLALFGGLNLLAGTAYELRSSRAAMIVSTQIVPSNAVVLGALGAYVATDDFGSTAGWRAAGWWFAGLGLAHVGAGLLLLRLQPRNPHLAVLLFR